MRYRIGDDPATGATATDDMLLLTVVIGLVVGMVLIWLARRGRQRWWMVGSVGRVRASIAYMAWAAMN